MVFFKSASRRDLRIAWGKRLQSFDKLVFKNFKFVEQGGECYLYRSCIALFYRKRLPQQQGDRRIGERETSIH